MFKVHNKNTRTIRCLWMMLLLLILNNFTPFSSVSVVDFEQVNVSRVIV